jgi:putative phosphoesterase
MSDLQHAAGGAQAPSVRIGLISDTHGRLRPELFERLAGVQRILHAGDVGSGDLLVELDAIAPVTAVYGNVDGWELRRTLPQVARVEEAGRIIVVVHGDSVGSPTPGRLVREHPGADVIVYGHTHQPRVERVGACLVVNPGSAGPARFHLKPSFGILTLDGDGEHVEILEL